MTDRFLDQNPSEGDILQAEEVQEQVLRGEIPGLKAHRANWRTTAALLISTMLAAACTRASAVAEQPGIANPPAASEPAEKPAGTNGTGGAQVETTPGGTQPTAPESAKAPEKAVNCNILSPQACATGQHIEWTSPAGNKFRGIGFTLKPGEQIKIPKELQVSKSVIKQPDVYNGVQVIAKTMDNSETYQFYGNITNDSPEGLSVGVVDEGDLTVFKDYPYNLIFRGPTGFMEQAFPDITKQPPKVVNNAVPGNAAANAPLFYDIPPKA